MQKLAFPSSNQVLGNFFANSYHIIPGVYHYGLSRWVIPAF
jgi:hypothetical protein